jgi:transcriptional regulator with XRE-family HTH domain
MTESQISDIERGRNNPGWLLVMRLLNAGLEATLAELVAAYENSDPEPSTSES